MSIFDLVKDHNQTKPEWAMYWGEKLMLAMAQSAVYGAKEEILDWTGGSKKFSRGATTYAQLAGEVYACLLDQQWEKAEKKADRMKKLKDATLEYLSNQVATRLSQGAMLRLCEDE